MAFALLSHVVADLTLGKPALSWLASSASVRDALSAFKLLGDDVTEISIWDCSVPVSDLDLDGFDNHVVTDFKNLAHSHCCCIGKICMQKLICYLASDESLSNLVKALDAPVSLLLGGGVPRNDVRHIDPQASLLEALELISAGAQNLVVPITRRATLHGSQSRSSVLQKHMFMRNSNVPLRKDHNGQEYCWLTQEDVLRFLLGSISVFSPLSVMSIEDLGIIKTDVQMVMVEEDAMSALEKIKAACLEMTAVAVVDNLDGKPGAFQLIGDISCSTLQTCNETASLALATLSAGDFLVYTQDCRNPPYVLVDMVGARIHDKLHSLKGDQSMQQPVDVDHLLQGFEIREDSSSEDDESGADSPTGPHDLSHKWHSAQFRGSRVGYTVKSRSGPIFCQRKSSLIAVLLQALAHREHYVWVTSEDDTLLGIVTFASILSVMLSHVNVFYCK